MSFIKSLKKLFASSYDCRIDQNGIWGLELVEFNAGNNSKIINVSFMKSLKILNAYGNCGINQNGIMKLELVEFNADNNSKITDVSFMKSLKIKNVLGSNDEYAIYTYNANLPKNIYTNFNKFDFQNLQSFSLELVYKIPEYDENNRMIIKKFNMYQETSRDFESQTKLNLDC